jgi:hypothetical protein
MLIEIAAGRRKEGNLNRRWFNCQSVDLYIWQTASDEVVQFQVCHKRPPKLTDHGRVAESVITWRKEEGFCFNVVLESKRYSTPVLEQSKPFDVRGLKEGFLENATHSDSKAVQFVTLVLKGLH